MTNLVLYWQGIANDDSSLSGQAKEIVKKILAGQYKAVSLESLQVGGRRKLYSARVNRSGRLLFTTTLMNGKQHLLILEEIFNHDYHKSKFLKPGFLKTYLGRQENRPLIYEAESKEAESSFLFIEDEGEMLGQAVVPV